MSTKQRSTFPFINPRCVILDAKPLKPSCERNASKSQSTRDKYTTLPGLRRIMASEERLIMIGYSRAAALLCLRAIAYQRVAFLEFVGLRVRLGNHPWTSKCAWCKISGYTSVFWIVNMPPPAPRLYYYHTIDIARQGQQHNAHLAQSLSKSSSCDDLHSSTPSNFTSWNLELTTILESERKSRCSAT